MSIERSATTKQLGAGITVFVADDEALICRLVRRILARVGVRVEEAPDGASALAWLEEHSADVVLLDMSMPDMDGPEVAARLRERGCPSPIVFVSGSFPTDPGAGRLAKPFTPAELVAVVEQALAGRT